MKRILVFTLVLSFLFVACKVKKKEEVKENEASKIAYASFGEKIESRNALSEKEMSEKFDATSVIIIIFAKC